MRWLAWSTLGLLAACVVGVIVIAVSFGSAASERLVVVVPFLALVTAILAVCLLCAVAAGSG